MRRPSVLLENSFQREEDGSEYEMDMPDSDEDSSESSMELPGLTAAKEERDWSKPFRKTCDWSKPSKSKSLTSQAMVGRRGKMQRSNSLSSITESRDDDEPEAETRQEEAPKRLDRRAMLVGTKGSVSISNLGCKNTSKRSVFDTSSTKHAGEQVSFTIRCRRPIPNQSKSMGDSIFSALRLEQSLSSLTVQDVSEMSSTDRSRTTMSYSGTASGSTSYRQHVHGVEC